MSWLNRFLNPNRDGSSDEASRADIENNDETQSDEPPPRFEYNPTGLFSRMFVGMGLKTKLSSSCNVNITYNVKLKWALVIVVGLLTVFLTPNLLPKWLGYKWSEPRDLCQKRTAKLKRLRTKMENLARVSEGARFVEQAERAVQCAESAVKYMWSGRGRILYPTDCTPKNALAKTRTHRVCRPKRPYRKSVCAHRIIRIRGLTCRSVTVNPHCVSVKVTGAVSQQKVEELKARQKARLEGGVARDVKESFTTLPNTADEKAEHVIRRLVWQTDIANNLYVLYALLAIVVGAPLVIYKRDLKTKATRRSLALRKTEFVVLVLLALVLYDYGKSLMFKLNFPRLFRYFYFDPCYLDSDFSKSRLKLIGATCGNITIQRTKLEVVLANFSRITFDAELCEVCSVNGTGPHENRLLVNNIKGELDKYNDGQLPGYTYPGVCNMSMLDNETSSPSDSGVSFMRAFFGSGVIAQLFLKGVLVNFLIHGCAYCFDAMVLHSGEVEIFGVVEDTHQGLTREEEGSVRRFARDKHLIAYTIVSFLMVWELVVIAYSIFESKSHKDVLLTLPGGDRLVSRWEYNCHNNTQFKGILLSRNVTLNLSTLNQFTSDKSPTGK